MVCSARLQTLIEVIAATPSAIPDLTHMATGITTDTRQLLPGSVFVALRGEHFDGHDFVGAALAGGAIAAIVAPDFAAVDQPVLVVNDPLQAYQAIARWWRQQFTVPVIAVTGSVGKTTTKELIAALLGTAGRVLKSPANHNNEIGLPRTLLTLDASYDYVVVEMGMRGRGEIALLTQIAQPDIGVITNVGTAHIGRLGSEQAIAEAKCELLAEMPPTSVAVLNHDNQRLMATAATVWTGRTITYGLQGGDVGGTVTPDGLTLQLQSPLATQLPLPLPGEHHGANLLVAIAVAQALGLDGVTAAQNVTVALPPGRSHRIELNPDILVLDETYNAGMESMLAALKLLAQTPGQRHIAVLGTMKELGEHTVALHHQVGAMVQALQLDYLLILAEPDAAIALKEGALPVPAIACATPEELGRTLQTLIQPGDRLLFKASRSVQLDQVVDQFVQQWQSNA